MGFDLAKLIHHWTKSLILFTNGKSTLTEEQTQKMHKKNIEIIETEINSLEHTKGKVQHIILKNNTKVSVKAIYARPAFVQHCTIPQELGCELNEQGLIKTDMFQKTSVAGVYAGGDNSSFGRAISAAVATGSMAGAALNRELIDEEF